MLPARDLICEGHWKEPRRLTGVPAPLIGVQAPDMLPDHSLVGTIGTVNDPLGVEPFELHGAEYASPLAGALGHTFLRQVVLATWLGVHIALLGVQLGEGHRFAGGGRAASLDVGVSIACGEFSGCLGAFGQVWVRHVVVALSIGVHIGWSDGVACGDGCGPAKVRSRARAGSITFGEMGSSGSFGEPGLCGSSMERGSAAAAPSFQAL